MPEWFVSILMMERALDAVVRRAKRVDRKRDIPYLAGYSERAIAPARGECICGKRSACMVRLIARIIGVGIERTC